MIELKRLYNYVDFIMKRLHFMSENIFSTRVRLTCAQVLAFKIPSVDALYGK